MTDVLPPDVRLVAEQVCTEKELAALRLWNPGVAGYKSVALALDISPDTARDRIKRAIRKIEKQTRRETL